MAKILIVDDRPVNRQVLKEILKYGHEIMEEEDGTAALPWPAPSTRISSSPTS